MTDLEITRLCAEAMGYEYSDASGTVCVSKAGVGNYDPLHDDAQAMALVKKLGIAVYHECRYPDSRVVWIAWRMGDPSTKIVNSDLNRAACECVAEIQKGKIPA